MGLLGHSQLRFPVSSHERQPYIISNYETFLRLLKTGPPSKPPLLLSPTPQSHTVCSTGEPVETCALSFLCAACLFFTKAAVTLFSCPKLDLCPTMQAPHTLSFPWGQVWCSVKPWWLWRKASSALGSFLFPGTLYLLSLGFIWDCPVNSLRDIKWSQQGHKENSSRAWLIGYSLVWCELINW